MGVDIITYLEAKDDSGKWRSVAINYKTKEWKYVETEEDFESFESYSPFGGRSSALNSFLGLDTFIKPIAELRGIPEDLSDYLKNHFNEIAQAERARKERKSRRFSEARVSEAEKSAKLIEEIGREEVVKRVKKTLARAYPKPGECEEVAESRVSWDEKLVKQIREKGRQTVVDEMYKAYRSIGMGEEAKDEDYLAAPSYLTIDELLNFDYSTVAIESEERGKETYAQVLGESFSSELERLKEYSEFFGGAGNLRIIFWFWI